MSLKRSRLVLILLHGFVAFTAIFGAILVVPTMPLAWIKAGPFTDWTVPAIALGLLVGGSAVVAVLLLIADARLGAFASMVAGAAIVAFELVEITVVGFTLTEFGPDEPVAWLQVVYLVVGATQLVLAYRLWRRVAEPRARTRYAH